MTKNNSKPRENAWVHSKRYKNQLKRMRDDVAHAQTREAALSVAKDLKKAGIKVRWNAQAAPDLPSQLNLAHWAKHRAWFVHAVADWLTARTRRDQKKDKLRFDIAVTLVTLMGMVPFGSDWGKVVKARQRWMRSRFSRLPRTAVMAGYIDVSLNRDPNHVWTWSLHEHVIVSLRAKSLSAAKTKVRGAFSPKKHEGLGIVRPLLVRRSDYPVGYLAYATRAVHPFAVKTREEWIKQGKLKCSYRKLRGSQRHELVRNMSLIRPQDRILLGGLKQEGKSLKRSRRGKT